MSWAGMLVSGYASLVVGTGILKFRSAEEAAKFLGTAKQIVDDPLLYAKLTTNEKNIIKRGIEIYENGLYRIQYEAEYTKIANRAKASMKFYNADELRTAIVTLDDANRLKFLDQYVNLSPQATTILKNNPQIVKNWNNLTEANKLLLSKNSDEWIKGLSDDFLDLLKNNDHFLQGWARYKYHPETKLVEVFGNMAETQKIALLRRYGDCSEEGLKMIAHNPELHINRLLKYPEATHDVAYFNNRRTEMLPPNFVDGKTKDMIRTHEVDNYIGLVSRPEITIHKKESL